MGDIQVRTQINQISFTTAVQPGRCRGDIRSGKVDFTYKIVGEEEKRINTAPRQPVPPPPEQEQPPTPDNDPVQMLLNDGWTVTEFVRDETGRPTPQPAGFGRLGVFERIDLRFEFPLFCTCPGAPPSLCRVRRFVLTVKYDGIAHPTIGMLRSAAANCNDAESLVPDRDVLPAASAVMERFRSAAVEFHGRVPCVCIEDAISDDGYGGQAVAQQVEKEATDGEAGSRLRRRNCNLLVTVGYDYRDAAPRVPKLF